MNKKSVNKGKQLKFAREYRGHTQVGLCKEIKGLSQGNLSRFEKGFEGAVNDDKLVEIMELLNFPVSFLDAIIRPVYTSYGLIY